MIRHDINITTDFWLWLVDIKMYIVGEKKKRYNAISIFCPTWAMFCFVLLQCDLAVVWSLMHYYTHTHTHRGHNSAPGSGSDLFNHSCAWRRTLSVSESLRVSVYVCTCICVYACLCVRVCVCVCAHAYACMKWRSQMVCERPLLTL